MNDTIQYKGEWTFPVESNVVRDETLSRNARLLYVVLKSYQGPNGMDKSVNIGILRNHLALSQGQVIRCMKELKASKYGLPQ